MHKFYFNDCLPSCSNQHEFIDCLSNTLIEFNKLTNEDLNIEKAIVTEKLPSALFLGNTYSLEDTISKIHDRSLKRLAFSYFQKYPIRFFPHRPIRPDELVLLHIFSVNKCLQDIISQHIYT